MNKATISRDKELSGVDLVYNSGILAVAASIAQCSELALIKECVRIFNSTPKGTKLTLIINTSHTEHYTGDDGDRAKDQV